MTANPAPRALDQLNLVALAPSRRARIAGRIVTGIVAAFLAIDAAMKLARVPAVVEISAKMGFSLAATTAIGAVLALCLVLYLVPRTAVLGAVLLTGYLGGAIATHVHLGESVVASTAFPLACGALVWLGLGLRDPRVRALVA